uniref:DENN domain containing 1A n=1 Tax=Chrysemys picta bellii TaxID=8478 RepID=A0A8C3FS75_CHRPI
MGSRIKQNPETTFEVYVEVTCPGTSSIGADPEVRRKFPEDYSDQEVLQTLTKFCFPFYVDSLTVSQVGQNFTFVLTDIDSKQRFGFCRLSSGAKSCFCILSYLPWFEVFYKLLNILADYTAKGQDSQRNELLETLHKLPIPDPGTPVNLSVHSYFSVPDITELPSIPENRNLTEYFVAVDVNNMLHLYASMLYERRILICCSKLSTVSALKNRLKKVSTTTGDGVARAFLKAQASFFGSYRNALKIEPEEPITFCEETFVSHRSTAMRQFLQNAIQLQLFKQFIDGRLDRLNSGEGFSDVFEEEINMGEYAGSDRLYHQWLSTVRKGSGAIINTVKTKANPAMKTVYKFAKDHAKMGIKEVKNRLKQKDIAENGCSATPEESLPRTAPSPLGEKKDPKLREDRRPITVHFGQVRPPRPHVVKRPKSNIAVEGRRTSVSSPEHLVKPMRHYTVFLSEDSSGDEFQQEEDPVSAFSENFFFSAPFEWPQPYRALKESDSADGEEVLSPEKAEEALPPDSPTPDKVTEVNLLEDIFTNLEVEKQPQPLSQAKSLEDLRTPKEEGVLQCTFDYQRLDLGESERSRIVPAVKLSHPYNKLWSMGHDDMAIPTKYAQSSPERPLTSFGTIPSIPRRPRSRDSILVPAEKEEGNTAIQGNITIPRPQGRKTPEQGIVPPPPAPRPTKPQTPAGTADAVNTYTTGRSDLVSELMQEPFGAGNVSLDPEFRQSVTYSPHPSQLLSSSSSTTEMLQPVKVNTENAGSESDYLLSLLDPLKTTSWQNMGSQQGSSSMQRSASPSSAAGFASVVGDFASPPPAPFTQPLGYPPSAPPFLQPSLNPFTQTVPAALTISLVRPPGGPFTPPLGHAYSSSFMTPNSGFYQPQRPKPNIAALSMPHLFGQAPTAPQASSFLQQSHNPSPASSLQPARPSKIRTLPASHSGSKLDVKQGLALSSNDPPLIPPRPAKGLESVLLPSKPEETKDPFEDLLKKTKQEVSATPGKVEQLRKQWETFE